MSIIKPNDLQNLIVLMNDVTEYPIEYRIALTAYDKGIRFNNFFPYIRKVFYVSCSDPVVLRIANYLKDFSNGINLPIKGSSLYKRLLMEYPIKD